MERLQKYLAACGVASRRAAENLILEGKVTVNGLTVKTLGTKVNPERDTVRYLGKIVRKETNYVYFLLNKPKGYISTVKDERGRKTVLDLLPHISERIFPVGRLDNATEGLLLLTNDGELTQLLLHPKFGINKTYRALVDGIVPKNVLQDLASGIMLEDGLTAPATIEILEYDLQNKRTKLDITISEGRNRQVRRMFEAIKHPVINLKRIRFATLNLKGVARGKFRPLKAQEVSQLKKLANGDAEAFS